MEPKVALAPVGTAIQRLVAEGQERPSVTIRFEQSGSLSVRLGMQNGEIAARIQTDGAGLDKALKSGWGEFAQDWNGRGIKLAALVIIASAHAHSHGEHSPNGSAHRDWNCLVPVASSGAVAWFGRFDSHSKGGKAEAIRRGLCRERPSGAMSTVTFTVGGTFPPPRLAAYTRNEAISAALVHQRWEGLGHECERDFLSAVVQYVATLLKFDGINTAFVAKQLNTEPLQTRPPLRSPGRLHPGETGERIKTHSVTF